MHPNESDNRQTITSPCDLLEEIFESNSWPYERYGDDEIKIEVSGDWCNYSMYFYWNEARECFFTSVRISLKLPDGDLRHYAHLLQLLNVQMNIGHIDISPIDGCPTWRLTVPVRGMGTITREMVEDIIDFALDECDKTYPAFQLYLFGKHSPEEAVNSVMFETTGIA